MKDCVCCVNPRSLLEEIDFLRYNAARTALLETYMRDALFFLSLTMLASLYGMLGMPLGLLIALPLLAMSFWFVMIRGGKTIFHLLAFLLITMVIVKGALHSPLGRHMQVAVTLSTVVLIFAFAGVSKEIDIAPTFAIFVAVMLFLRTFVGVPIPDKLSWGIITFLMIASRIDDWNLKHRPLEERHEQRYLSE